MTKLIALDMDGTLLSTDHKTVSLRTVKALKNARNKGIKIVIATGRTLCQIKDVIDQIDVDYIIVSNGASSLDKDSNVIAVDGMAYEDWKKVYDVLEENGIVTEVYMEGKTYLETAHKDNYTSKYINGQLIEELKEAINYRDNITESLKDQTIEKLTSIYVPKEKYDMLKKKVEDMGYSVTSSLPFIFEVNKKGVNKGKGLEQLCTAIGIKQDDTMAFGDGGNDVEMLLWAEKSYAMENAVEDAKIAAKYMTDSNAEDGVAKIVETIL